MSTKKVLVLLTDGVSLRNFVYSSFIENAEKQGLDLVFWNGTDFDLQSLGLKQIPLSNKGLHWLTNIFKNARKHVELNCFEYREKDPIYQAYKFPFNTRGVKNVIRTFLTRILILICNHEAGLNWLRGGTNWLERRTPYFRASKVILDQEQPDIVFNTSQRSVLAIAPIEAAKSIGIATVGFVFSWDNLPKSTLEVETDLYHVWSKLMKNELLKYHAFIEPDQIIVTGTPQFEMHLDETLAMDRDVFFGKYKLKTNLEYYCFSGDDVTTSPQDERYLRDVAVAIRALNNKGHSFGLVFRPCPVDFSDRYNEVLSDFEDIITVIRPKWEQKGGAWNQIFPKKEDNRLLYNLGRHCLGVINLGSSMVFDFACHSKPCYYMNYHYDDNLPVKGVHVYNYVHFRSMPSIKAVYWLNDPEEIETVLLNSINYSNDVVKESQNWFKTINQMQRGELPSVLINSGLKEQIEISR